jgi:predicted phosphodiesterase
MVQAIQRVLLLPDIHVPDHDERALGLVRDFAKQWKPNRVCQMGDLMNADQVSSFPNECETDLSDEFEVAGQILDDLKVTDWLEGNHEERLRRVGLTKKNMRKLLNPAKNLGMDKRRINWKPYHKTEGILRFGKLNVLHGFYCNEYAARKHSDAYGCCVFGHTHRIQAHQPKHAFESHTGYNIGCLCKLDLPYRQCQPPDGWGQGFAFAYILKSGHFSLQMVRLIGNEVVIEGTVYRR